MTKKVTKATDDTELKTTPVENEVDEVTDVAEVTDVTDVVDEENNEGADNGGEKTDEEAEKVELEEREVKAHYDAKEKIAVASTDVVDRHNESISQEGWDLKNFKANPVLLWGHDHTEIAVGKAKNIHIERASGKPRLVFTPEFHDKTEKAKALKELFDEGWLNSFSVGFMPKEFDGKTNRYMKQELLEISAVNVPANPEARTLAYKALVGKGFKKSVAKDVSGVEDEPANDIIKSPKGAVADEINAEEVWELKHNKMSDAREIWWAFCDVFYNENTDVADFEKLLTETVGLLSKVIDGSYQSPDISNNEEEPVEDAAAIDATKSKVLDNDLDNVEDDNNTAKAQANTETSAAPQVHLSKEARAKQSLHKVIVKASDKLLQNSKSGTTSQDSTEMIKVIKRAAEILSKANK